MLSSILRTENASIISIKIIRAFVNMRHFINNNYFNLVEQTIKNTNKITNIEKKMDDINETIENLFSKFKSSDFKELIFFNGQIYDAYSKIIDILNQSKEELIIIDSYADKLILDIISKINSKVILITKEHSNLKSIDINKYFAQYNNLTIIYNNTFHDRYFILDKKEIFHCGTSINHAGQKTFSINKLEDDEIINIFIKKIEKISENNKNKDTFDI